MTADEKNPLRRVLLLRHGVTDWNVERRWQGRVDVPLNAEGLHQAEGAAAALVRDSEISVVAYSTARRASQTAAVIKGAFDLAGRPPTMLSREDLVEIDVGQWEGQLQADVRTGHPDLLGRIGRDPTLRYGTTGETLIEVAQRAEEAVASCLSYVPEGQALLVVTHGAVIASLTRHLTGMDAGGAVGGLGSMRNCHWAELTCEPAGWRVERWNVKA